MIIWFSLTISNALKVSLCFDRDAVGKIKWSSRTSDCYRKEFGTLNMKSSITFCFSILIVIINQSLAGEVLTRVGSCVETKIKEVSTRLEDTPGSGSAVAFANGEFQVSYDQIEAVDQSRAGDPVRLCLVAIPKNCPKGDNRGYKYRTTNLRTHKSWTLFNSSHMCGGA